MSDLIVKVMSREPLQDSDPRKSFKLIPVPEGHEVEFQRTEIADVVNMLFTALYGDSRGSMIPLIKCGKVYVLQDGRTVSTFDPAPQPAPQINVQGTLETKSGPDLQIQADTIELRGGDIKMSLPQATVVKLSDVDAYKLLKADLDYLAPVNVYPWANRWNDAIAQCVVTGLNQTTLSLTDKETTARDSEAVGRYFARVRDAMLSAKEMMFFSWQTWGDRVGPDIYQATFGGTPPQTQDLRMTQTNKQALIDADVNGLVMNNVERAIKLLNHGAHTVLMTHKLRITEAEVEIIKALFRNVFQYSVKFHFEGELLVSMSFDKITQTGPAL